MLDTNDHKTLNKRDTKFTHINKQRRFKYTKQGVGVACCRLVDNKKQGKDVELLLIQRRCTYQFFDFVFGKYDIKDDDMLVRLFSEMTVQEKIDILTLKFEYMWYKLWMTFPEDDFEKMKDTSMKKSIPHKLKSNTMTNYTFYVHKKNIFKSLVGHDGAKRLRELIDKSSIKNNELFWEIPKGRLEKGESPIDCATREFNEETGMCTNDYFILTDLGTITDSYIHDNVRYVHTYYIAFTSDKKKNMSVDFTNAKQLLEVGSIKWVNKNKLKDIDSSGRLSGITDKIFDLISSRYRYIK